MCRSLVQKVFMFFQKKASHCRNSLALVPRGHKHYIFGSQFYSKNASKLKFLWIRSTSGKMMISYVFWHKNGGIYGIWAFWHSSSKTSHKIECVGPQGPNLCIWGFNEGRDNALFAKTTLWNIKHMINSI